MIRLLFIRDDAGIKRAESRDGASRVLKVGETQTCRRARKSWSQIDCPLSMLTLTSDVSDMQSAVIIGQSDPRDFVD